MSEVVYVCSSLPGDKLYVSRIGRDDYQVKPEYIRMVTDDGDLKGRYASVHLNPNQQMDLIEQLLLNLGAGELTILALRQGLNLTTVVTEPTK